MYVNLCYWLRNKQCYIDRLIKIHRLIKIGRCYGKEMYVAKTQVVRISKQPPPTQIMILQKQPKNVEYFSCLGSSKTNDARCIREIRTRSSMAKTALNKKALSSSKLDFNVMKKLVKCYTWSIVLYGADTWTLWEVNQQYLENFEMWFWRRMVVSWTNFVKYEKYYMK